MLGRLLIAVALLLFVKTQTKAGEKDYLQRGEEKLNDKVEIKYLANDKAYPPGLQPAFALKGGYLVLASSPEAIRRFTPPTGRTPSIWRGIGPSWLAG